MFLACPLGATTAITTTTMAGAVQTVNSAGHGLAVNQGFCITGAGVASNSVCGVVATATANSFTMTVAGVAACASSCGTVAAAPQIIILTISHPSQGYLTVSYLFWLTTTSGVAVNGSSQYSAATGAQVAAINAGRFVEFQTNHTFPASFSVANIKLLIQADYLAAQATLAANSQPGAFFNDTFDGTAWAF